MPLALLIGAIPLAAAAWTDGRTGLIPDVIPVGVLLCGVLRVATGGLPLMEAAMGVVLVGFVLMFCALWRHRDGIGGGDIKLCAAVGGLLGPVPTLLAVAAALCALLLCGVFTRKKSMPFAPFFFPVYGLILCLEMIRC